MLLKKHGDNRGFTLHAHDAGSRRLIENIVSTGECLIESDCNFSIANIEPWALCRQLDLAFAHCLPWVDRIAYLTLVVNPLLSTPQEQGSFDWKSNHPY